MKIKCPACGAVASLDVLITHAGAREMIFAAGKLPPQLADLVFRYLGLFRPEKSSLSFSRMASLLSELIEPMTAHQVTRDRKQWPASDEMWKEAFEHMLNLREKNKLSLPLASHGYLFEIIAGYSNKKAAQTERRQEIERKYGSPTRTEGFNGIGGVIQNVFNNQTPEGRAKGRAAMKAALEKGNNNDS